MSPTTDQNTILSELAGMLDEVMGALLMVDEITMETSFSTDLELESIDFVALTELLMERYGDRVDFTSWVADMDPKRLVSLNVGDVVTFVVDQLDSEGTA